MALLRAGAEEVAPTRGALLKPEDGCSGPDDLIIEWSAARHDVEGREGLLHRHALGQVARLVDVAAS